MVLMDHFKTQAGGQNLKMFYYEIFGSLFAHPCVHNKNQKETK